MTPANGRGFFIGHYLRKERCQKSSFLTPLFVIQQFKGGVAERRQGFGKFKTVGFRENVNCKLIKLGNVTFLDSSRSLKYKHQLIN